MFCTELDTESIIHSKVYVSVLNNVFFLFWFFLLFFFFNKPCQYTFSTANETFVPASRGLSEDVVKSGYAETDIMFAFNITLIL